MQKNPTLKKPSKSQTLQSMKLWCKRNLCDDAIFIAIRYYYVTSAHNLMITYASGFLRQKSFFIVYKTFAYIENIFTHINFPFWTFGKCGNYTRIDINNSQREVTICVSVEVSRDFAIKLDYIKSLTSHTVLCFIRMTFAREISANTKANIFLSDFG